MIENMKQCSNNTCGRTYNMAEYVSTINICYSCNQKRLVEKRKADALRNRNKPRKRYHRDLERLAYIEESK